MQVYSKSEVEELSRQLHELLTTYGPMVVGSRDEWFYDIRQLAGHTEFELQQPK